MSTNYAPMQARGIRNLYRPGPDEPGSMGKIRDLVREGRKIVADESTRWDENRRYFRGEQAIFANPTQRQVRALATGQGRLGRTPTHNPYNHLRRFIEARVSLMTKERPPYEIDPEDQDADSIDAARQAEKFVAARWGQTGWNIKSRLVDLAKNGEIDGISWLYVGWNPDIGGKRDQMIAVTADGQPVTDRGMYESLKAQDPEMQTLWRMERTERPLGDVEWRVVLPAAISVDPLAADDFRQARWICESRLRPRQEVERKLGMSFKQAVRESRELDAAGGATGPTVEEFRDVATDGGQRLNEKDYVVVHYFYAKPSEDFPRGAYIEFCDRAPNRPIRTAEWDDELPYFCFVPRPDPGHFLRSRATADDLKPIQRDYNETRRDLREWLRRMARNPVILPEGALASDSLYNDEGFAFIFPGLGEPHYMNTPSEPTAVFTNDLQNMVREMEAISGVSSLSQGMRSPGDPEAAAGINLRIQQTEQQLSETEAQLVEAIEWGVQRSLILVERHYIIPRAVIGVGVDDSEQFKAFQGAMLRGAHRFRVNGPLMPKSKAARMQAIFQLVPYIGDAVRPYIANLIDGDPSELQRDVEIDRQHEKGAIRELVGLATNPMAMEVFKNFEEDKQAFSQAFNAVVQAGAQDPMGELAQRGITPPQMTQALMNAGFDLPLVEDFHNNALALKAIDEFRKSDGYRRLHPMGKQLLRERAEAHKRGLAQQVGAMAQQMPVGQQSGSEAAPKGTPSPPKQGPGSSAPPPPSPS